MINKKKYVLFVCLFVNSIHFIEQENKEGAFSILLNQQQFVAFLLIILF